MKLNSRKMDLQRRAAWLWPLVWCAAVAALVELVDGRAQLIVGLVGAAVLGSVVAWREHALWTLCLTDPLTGLANRRGFEQHFQQVFTRRLRDGESMALLLIDCDHFKQLNDRYGHAAGDRALQALVQSLRGSVRREDVIGRWGGDEFVVLLRDADEEVVRRVATRVNQLLHDAALFTGSRPAEICTVSVGCVMRDASQTRRVRLGRLLSAADRALYLAKRRGGAQLAVVGRRRLPTLQCRTHGGES